MGVLPQVPQFANARAVKPREVLRFPCLLSWSVRGLVVIGLDVRSARDIDRNGDRATSHRPQQSVALSNGDGGRHSHGSHPCARGLLLILLLFFLRAVTRFRCGPRQISSALLPTPPQSSHEASSVQLPPCSPLPPWRSGPGSGRREAGGGRRIKSEVGLDCKAPKTTFELQTAQPFFWVFFGGWMVFGLGCPPSVEPVLARVAERWAVGGGGVGMPWACSIGFSVCRSSCTARRAAR